MSFFRDTKETVGRFQNHLEAFEDLFRTNDMAFGNPKDIWPFVMKTATEQKFRRDLLSLGNSVLRREGGKVSLTVLFTIIGVAIGGVGIAAMGSAVGLPAVALAALLGSVGFGVGQEIDTAIGSSPRADGKSNRPAETRSAGPFEGTSGVTLSNDQTEIADPSAANRIVEAQLITLIMGLQSIDNAMSSIKSDLQNRVSRIDGMSVQLEALDEKIQTVTALEHRLFEHFTSESAAAQQLAEQRASRLELAVDRQALLLRGLRTWGAIALSLIAALSVASAILLLRLFESAYLSNVLRH
jgi:hypothetical protein